MASRSERVLVTGAEGFTGALLTQALRADGHEVIGATRFADSSDLVLDLLDGDQVAAAIASVRPTSIVHLAGIAFAPDENLHQLYATNVAGTAALLKAARASGQLNSIVLASSARIYAAPRNDAALTEDAPISPGDHYGVSKWAVEQLARLFMSDLPITIVRPFNYTGPGQDPRFIVPKLVRAYAAGNNVEVGDLDVARDFSDVSTVVEAYRRLIASPQPAQTFNVCSGRPVELREICRLLEAITGHAINLSVNPAFVRADEPRVLVGAPQKLEAAIGALPRPAMRQTLEAMVAAA